MLDKKTLSERDICTKFITPAIEKAGWDKMSQCLEEVSFTDGKIYVRGRMTARGERKRADYILYYKPNTPIAIIEAKDNHHRVGAGMQQVLNYARTLDIPCVFSTNRQDNISVTQSNNIKVPLPTIEKQTRIVKRIEELMNPCDELQKCIQASREQNEILLQQVLKATLQTTN